MFYLFVFFYFYFSLYGSLEQQIPVDDNFIIPIVFLCELFTPASANNLSLEFEWLQVSTDLKNFSQYSGLYW